MFFTALKLGSETLVTQMRWDITFLVNWNVMVFEQCLHHIENVNLKKKTCENYNNCKTKFVNSRHFLNRSKIDERWTILRCRAFCITISQINFCTFKMYVELYVRLVPSLLSSPTKGERLEAFVSLCINKTKDF